MSCFVSNDISRNLKGMLRKHTTQIFQLQPDIIYMSFRRKEESHPNQNNQVKMRLLRGYMGKGRKIRVIPPPRNDSIARSAGNRQKATGKS